MKTFRFLKTTLLILLLFNLGCNNEEDNNINPNDGEIDQQNGISEDDLENYPGDLGLLINTRDLEKKGYKPTSIDLTTSASEGDYDQQIVIDPFTSMGQLNISVEDLTESAAAELRDGIGIQIEVLDDENNILTTESYSAISFEENGKQVDIDASTIDFKFQDLNFKDNMRYYLQLVDANGNYEKNVVWKPTSAMATGVRLEGKSSTFHAGTTTEQFFLYKLPNAENEFAIYSANTYRYLTIGLTTRTFRQSGAYTYPEFTENNSFENDYKFKVKKEPNGLYAIYGLDGNPLRAFNNNGVINWHTNSSGSIQFFRIIALDVDWTATELNTEHLPPIFPAAETSFGFNSTLKNCGSGSLEQQVGIEREITTTYTSSVSESIGLSGRVTTSVDVSVSATAEANFFGSGGSVTGEVSAGLEVSVEASSTTTIASERSVSETSTFFSNRIVTVPAGSASLVYDAYQTYSNVRIPYVKRLRLRGNHTDSSEPLTGSEIATQLAFTGFTGTVINTGSDFVEIALRGNMFLDNIVDTQTEVRDVPANCN